MPGLTAGNFNNRAPIKHLNCPAQHNPQHPRFARNNSLSTNTACTGDCRIIPVAMSLFQFINYLGLSLALVVIVVLVRDIIWYRNLPPGPTPLPFVGNRNQIPKVKPWLQMAKWAEEYGISLHPSGLINQVLYIHSGWEDSRRS